jgi:hypothetical protein
VPNRLHYNGVATGSAGALTALALGASLTSSATSITFNAALTHDNGTAVPTIASPDYLPLTILDGSGLVSEVVHLTAYTAGGTTGTIVRGRAGTSGVAHSSGDKIVHALLSFDAPHDLLSVPQAGIQSIDEFNDETIDSAWAQIDASGAASKISWIEAGDALSASLTGTDASGVLHALVRPVVTSLAVGDALVTCYNITGPDGSMPASLILPGIIAADGNTQGAGNQIVASMYNGNFQIIESWTGYNSGTGTLTQSTASFTSAHRLWIRLVKLASNVWRVDYSPNGIHWFISTDTITWANTPTYVGLFAISTTAKAIVTFECFRRMSGVT